MPTPAALPDLSHRAPDNRFVTDRPERVTVAWIDEQYDQLEQFLGEADADEARWLKAVRWHNELASYLQTAANQVQIAFRQATDDEQAAARYRELGGKLRPAWERRDIGWVRAVLETPALPAIEREFGAMYTQRLRQELAAHVPENIDLRATLSELLMGYTEIFSHATVTWRGETLPYSYARKAAHDTDRDERHAAFYSALSVVEDAEERLQEIYDEACRLRAQMGRNAGCRSYVELRYLEMGRADWGPEDAASFRRAISNHVVPLGKALRERQAQQLGAGAVHPADTAIWPQEPHPELRIGVEEQLDAALEAFGELGPAFAAPFAALVDEGLIDLPARPGKGTGAFCTSLFDYRVPFLFCNSVGAPDDVRTLVHEYGHGLQQWRSGDIELVALRWPTLEACEIHSMTLELLVGPHLGRFFGDDLDAFISEHVRATVMQVPYMAAVDEFQHEVFDPARDGIPGARERGDLWARLAGEYQPGIDWAAVPFLQRNRWLSQLHVFHHPFYYLDYALARVVSWQLWLRSLDDRDAALETYLRLCDLGGTRPFRELVSSAGLGDPFDEQVVASTMQTLRERLGL